MLAMSRWIDAANNRIERLVSLAILAAGAVTALNAVGRKFFNASFNDWLELQSMDEGIISESQ